MLREPNQIGVSATCRRSRKRLDSAVMKAAVVPRNAVDLWLICRQLGRRYRGAVVSVICDRRSGLVSVFDSLCRGVASRAA